jgi:integrase
VKVRLKGYPTQTATFTRKTDAKVWATQTEAAIRERRHFKTVEAQRHTLAELCKRYITDVLPTKPKAKQKQTMQLNWWKDQLGQYTLAEITPSRIAEARDKLLNTTTKRGGPMQPATVVRYMAALSAAYTTAVKEWEWVEENPLLKVRKPKEPRGRMRFLSEDYTDKDGKVIEGERTRLLKACQQSDSEHLYTVVVLALSTGMRAQEILQLTWDRVDTKRGRILLEETKNGERRVLPLVGKALELVKAKQQLREQAQAEDSDTPQPQLLFPGKRKKDRPAYLRYEWVAVLEAAGIEDFKFHDLRHSAASYLLMNGASLAEIAEVLGHKTLQMVKRYAHLSEVHTTGVVERMNKAVFGG